MTNNLVYQYWLGPGSRDYWTLRSLESAQSYAGRTDADYIFNTNPTLKGLDRSNKDHYYFGILDLIYDTKYDSYDDILYLDCDIVIHPKAANIFQLPEMEDCVDLAASMQIVHLEDYWEMYNVFKKVGAFFKNAYTSGVPYKHFNTGVILFTKKGRLRAREEWDVNWLDWLEINKDEDKILILDQPYINAMVNKHSFKLLELGTEWNHVPDLTLPNLHKAHFYHLHTSFGDDHARFFQRFRLE